jgi:hypothetical protein
MTTVIWLGLGIITLFGAAAWLAIWSRKDTPARFAALLLFLAGIPAVAAAGIEALGHHRPLWTAWALEPGDHRTLAVKMVQDQAIYLYLDTGREEPWQLRLPWDNEVANAIQRAIDEAPEGQEGQLMLRYEHSWDIHPRQFHPLPQPPALPAKPALPAAPHFEQDA